MNAEAHEQELFPQFATNGLVDDLNPREETPVPSFSANLQNYPRADNGVAARLQRTKGNRIEPGITLGQLQPIDCIAYLQKVNTKSIDLVLTDPPYEISRATGFDRLVTGVHRFAISMQFGAWDCGFTKLEATLNECYRVLKPSGTVIVFYDLWKITNLVKILETAGFKQLRYIEWLKTNPVPINSKRNYLTNAREIAITATKGGKPVFHSKYDNGIYRHPIYHGKGRFHPTQKPVELFKDLIKTHSNPGDTVLDPFMGSATTAIAAMQTRRQWTGCELDPDYYTKATVRIINEQAELL